jgi:hypothetical protein
LFFKDEQIKNNMQLKWIKVSKKQNKKSRPATNNRQIIT